MSIGNVVRGSSPQHASAVSRLAGARDEESRLRRVWAGAAGTTAEPEAQSQLSAGRAYVAAREEWLHWIDEGESLAPWQDGVWAPETAAVDRRRPEPNRVGRELRGNAERAGRR